MINRWEELKDEEFEDILYEIATVPMLLSIGDIASIAREELNNDVLAHWAEKNNRCQDCACPLNEDYDCPECDKE